MSCIIFSLQSEQIRTEFKLLARKHHPDKVSNEEHKAEGEEITLIPYPTLSHAFSDYITDIHVVRILHMYI